MERYGGGELPARADAADDKLGAIGAEEIQVSVRPDQSVFHIMPCCGEGVLRGVAIVDIEDSDRIGFRGQSVHDARTGGILGGEGLFLPSVHHTHKEWAHTHTKEKTATVEIDVNG